MSLAFVPLYIHFMGIEAYGLIGVFVTLQALFSLLDLGLSSTLNREMARLSVQENPGQEMRDLLRTLEAMFWPIGILIALALLVLAPLIANHWLQNTVLPVATIEQAVMLMGLAMALQWPFTFYSGALLGLQRQVLLNGVVIAAATLRSVGSVLVLWLVSPTILAFFAWQIAVSTVQTFAISIAVWRSLPGAERRACFRIELLRRIWRFAAGISGISFLALILTQVDKIVLSRLLTLEMFGYYTLASMVAMSLYRLITPLFMALYPRFTELAALGNEQALRQLYHRSCQLMSVVLLPVAVIVALFSKEILLIWTQNATTAENTSLILSLLIAGTALHGLINLPYALQLAHGWTSLVFYSNLVAILILIPLLFVMTSWYGAVGAALIWVLLNVGYVAFSQQIMHRRLLRGALGRWYVEDVGMPLLAVLVVAGIGRWLLTEGTGTVVVLATVGGSSLCALVAAALAAPEVRGWILNRIRVVPSKTAFRV